MMKLGPQFVFQNKIGILYGRKLSQNDPNEAKTENFEVFFHILGSFFVKLLSYTLSQNGFINSAITNPGTQ